jgi:hypothetical protein
MHVKTPLLVGAVLSGLALVACDGPPRGTASAAASASATVSSAASTAPDPATLTLARRAFDAATVLAKKCRIVGGSFSVTAADVCEWKPDELAALRDANAALRASPSLPRSGDGASFVDQLRLFADWVDVVRDLSKQGTLAHYQDLAMAWNRWRPQDRELVDPVPLSKYLVERGAASDAGHIVWSRCAEGPCIVAGVIDEKRGY